MSYTFRPTLLEINPDANGKYAVKICIYNTVTKKRMYRNTEFRLLPKQWDPVDRVARKSVANFALINQKLTSMINEMQKEILQKQLLDKPVNVRAIIQGKKTDYDLYTYWEKLISEMPEKKFSPDTISAFEFELKRMKKFAPGISFDDVDQSFLRKYENHLLEAGLANNTVHKIWKRLRKIFNSARKEHLTVNYPFEHYDNPKYKQTIRTFLLIEEVQKMEEALKKPLTEYQVVVANYFLLGTYSGLRYSDWARFNHQGFIQGDRILLGAKKNGEIIGMQMHDKLKAVVERLRDLPRIYSEPETNDILKGLAKVAGIEKHLTTHVARHSYATHCLRLKIQDDVICHTMGITKKTLQVYKHLIDASVDEEISRWNVQ